MLFFLNFFYGLSTAGCFPVRHRAMKQHPSITPVSWGAGALKLGSEGYLHSEGLERGRRKAGSRAKPGNGAETAFRGATTSDASV